MQTSLQIDGANCPSCFNQTLDDLAQLPGVLAVRGSFAGPCIELDHDVEVEVETINDVIRNRLHGIEMFANEVRMVPLEPITISLTCSHLQPADSALAEPVEAGDRSDERRIDPSLTLGDIVTLRPALAADLERRGLDYCCHGGRTLAEAAREAGLDAQTVADELSATHPDQPAAEWASLGPAELVDHIEAVHHRYLWAELPRISALVDKIVSVHGERHPELADVQRLYTALRADLEPHLEREEQELFPAIRQLATMSDRSQGDTQAIATKIAALMFEHETVGDLLEKLNSVTSNYTTPSDGCASYAASYRALAELESDTHLHIHKENNLLFPMTQAECAQPPGPRSSPNE